MRVPASGGRPTPAVTLPDGTTYRWPDRLDDETILATRWRSSADDAAVVAISLSSGAERVIAEPATFGRYATRRLRVVPARGRPVRGSRGSVHAPPAGHASPGGSRGHDRYDRRGAVRDLTTRIASLHRRRSGALAAHPRARGRPGPRDRPAHSAARTSVIVAVCGDRLAATVFARGQTDLWAGHLDRAAMTQITREGAASEPVWSPDCRTIAFSWNRTGVANIYTVAIESGEARGCSSRARSPALRAPGRPTGGGWPTPSAIRRPRATSGSGIARRVTVVRSSRRLEWNCCPRSRRMGSTSRTSPAPPACSRSRSPASRPGARAQVSVGGGTWPSWSADGRQLFFLHDSSIMRAGVEWHDGQVVATDPVALFTHPDIVLFKRSGDQFVWLRRTAGAVPLTRMNLVLNWFSELDRERPLNLR